VVHW